MISSDFAKASEKQSTDRLTWIGMEYVNNVWVWSDGTPTDYFKWAPKQPDNMKSEHCVEIYSDQSEWLSEEKWYEMWNNYDCNKVKIALLTQILEHEKFRLQETSSPLRE